MLKRLALKSPGPIPEDLGGEGESQHLSPPTSLLLCTTEGPQVRDLTLLVFLF